MGGACGGTTARGGPSGEVVHVEAAPGIVTVVAGWMLDPAACAAMGFGAPRVAIAALLDLHHLLTALGFRRSSATDVAQETRHEAVPTPADPSPAPAEPAAGPDRAPGQLSPDERREAVALLAALLIEASGAAAPEAADDRE